MRLRQALNQKTSFCDLSDLSAMMGYQKGAGIQAKKRIEFILSDELLGLYDGDFDFKYSNREFLYRLCEVLNIDIAQYSKDIENIESKLNIIKNGFSSYLFIDTEFKRTDEAIFILSFLEGRRNIFVGRDIRILPFQEQIPLIAEIVKNHYIDSGGELTIWGKIKRYAFYYEEDEKLVFNTDGGIPEEQPEIIKNRARTKLDKVVK